MSSNDISTAETPMGAHLIGLFIIDLHSAQLVTTPLQREPSPDQVDLIMKSILDTGIRPGDQLHAILHSEESALEGFIETSEPVPNLQVAMIAGQHRAMAVQKACRQKNGLPENQAKWACFLYRPCE